jgi:hypothetical protein
MDRQMSGLRTKNRMKRIGDAPKTEDVCGCPVIHKEDSGFFPENLFDLLDRLFGVFISPIGDDISIIDVSKGIENIWMNT